MHFCAAFLHQRSSDNISICIVGRINMALSLKFASTVAGSFSLYVIYYVTMLYTIFRPTPKRILRVRRPVASYFEKLQIFGKWKEPPPPPRGRIGIALDHLGEDGPEQLMMAAWICILFGMIGYVLYRMCRGTPIMDKTEQDLHERINASALKEEEREEIIEKEKGLHEEMLQLFDRIRKSGEEQMVKNEATLATLNARYNIFEDGFPATEVRWEH